MNQDAGRVQAGCCYSSHFLFPSWEYLGKERFLLQVISQKYHWVTGGAPLTVLQTPGQDETVISVDNREKQGCALAPHPVLMLTPVLSSHWKKKEIQICPLFPPSFYTFSRNLRLDLRGQVRGVGGRSRPEAPQYLSSTSGLVGGWISEIPRKESRLSAFALSFKNSLTPQKPLPPMETKWISEQEPTSAYRKMITLNSSRKATYLSPDLT